MNLGLPIAADATGVALYGAVLSASVLGSVHCAGMCGPLVAIYAAGEERKSRWVAHVAYHGVRGLVYTALGVLAGSLGTAIDWAGNAAGVAHVAALLCGTLVVLAGVNSIVPAWRGRSPWGRTLGAKLIRLGTKPRLYRASALGALAPLLPCGWLYAFVLAAGGTGSAVSGGVLMATFWAGTVPALLGVGELVSRVSEKVRARLPLLTGASLIIIGSLGVAHRMSHLFADGDERDPSAEGPKCH